MEHDGTLEVDRLIELLSSRRAYNDLKTALTRLGLMSHAGTVSYEGTSTSTVESLGGKRPPGAPEFPSRKDRDDFVDNYRQKPAEWFVAEFEYHVGRFARGKTTFHELETKIDELTGQVTKAIRDWSRTPPADQVTIQWQQAPGTKNQPTLEWRIRIANENGSSRDVAKKYGMSHTTVQRYREQYAGLEL